MLEGDRFVTNKSQEVGVTSGGDSEEHIKLNLLATNIAHNLGRLTVESYDLLLDVCLGDLFTK